MWKCFTRQVLEDDLFVCGLKSKPRRQFAPSISHYVLHWGERGRERGGTAKLSLHGRKTLLEVYLYREMEYWCYYIYIHQLFFCLTISFSLSNCFSNNIQTYASNFQIDWSQWFDYMCWLSYIQSLLIMDFWHLKVTSI